MSVEGNFEYWASSASGEMRYFRQGHERAVCRDHGERPGTLVEFGVLGPVEVCVAGRMTDAGHARQRAVLAVLLLDPGRMVSTELLIDRVWGEDRPDSARNVLYGYVARLRAGIAAAADPRGTLA